MHQQGRIGLDTAGVLFGAVQNHWGCCQRIAGAVALPKYLNHRCQLKKQLAGKTNFSPETRFANRAGEEDGDDVTWLAGDC